jgi:starch phosphorylase
MYTAREFTVLPTIPEPLLRLRTIASNLWWTWNAEAQDLFRRLDPGLWDKLNQNPILLLAAVEQSKLEEAAQDPAFLAHVDRVLAAFERDVSVKTWFERNHPDATGRLVAYFSAEFGLHECVPLYAGGLGVLAGDHLKSASDLGVPMVGVTLLYRQGYFQQRLSHEGRQFEEYPVVDFSDLPISPVLDEAGNQKRVTVKIADHDVHIHIWKAQVGRVVLYALDTYLPENSPEDREITARLYGGDQNMRIRQEMVLGFGGIRALKAVGCQADVFHMNEGHSAFLALERIRALVNDRGLSFAQAREAVTGSNIFTTHTPVPAGIDTFPADMVRHHVGYVAPEMGISTKELLSFGQLDPSRDNEPFSMAILALRLARACNGVSKIHASVARKMWHPLWKNVPVSEVPIQAVTNGVHIRTWQSLETARLFERYLGPDWHHDPDDEETWTRVEQIPDAELWRARERLRETLIARTRDCLKEQLKRRGASPSEVATADEVLNPEVLTIGFARRFAPYKRATLFLHDTERLTRLLTDSDRPIQFVFAGKAHPRDDYGKELIMKIVQFAREPEVRKRLVFLENYSMGIARFLVQGVDIWLNNPIRMLEASGTSGMKVPPNGGMNFSVLDGWWPEAYDGTNGWAIGGNVVYDNEDYQTQAEAASMYDLLEREIIPMFYDRGADGLPRRWIERMKSSMRTCCAQFSANRMLRDYTDMFYMPALEAKQRLTTNAFKPAQLLADWRQKLREHWQAIRIESVEGDNAAIRTVGDRVPVKAMIHLGELDTVDVSVELYHGTINGAGEIDSGESTAMQAKPAKQKGLYEYTGYVPCTTAGRFGFAVRILPKHPELNNRHEMGLIYWA